MKNLINSNKEFHLRVITISFLFLLSSFKVYSQEDKNKENENTDYRKEIYCKTKDWENSYFPVGVSLSSPVSAINPKARHKIFQFNLLYGESLNIFGLQAGLINTNCREFKDQPTYQVGLNLSGLLNQNDSVIGLNAGSIGNLSNKVYGVSLAGIRNSVIYQYGISFGSWENTSYVLNGIQLAIFENIIYTQNGIVFSVINNTTGPMHGKEQISNGFLFAGLSK